MTEGLTAPQLVQAARARGIQITARTLRLYGSMGLIPRPLVRPGAAGGRTGYYRPEVLDLLAAIERLKGSGQSLEQVKEFLDRLNEIARGAGRDPLEVQTEAFSAIAMKSGGQGRNLESIPILRSLGGRVTAEMVKNGLLGVDDISEMVLLVQTRSKGTVFIPVFVNPKSLEIRTATPDDDSELAPLISTYCGETQGAPREMTPDDVRDWMEKSWDISRDNFIVARRRPHGPIAGFVALAVEPERLRAGQVRLEGPYVVPQCRGHHIASELMRLVEEKARDLGAKYIDSFVHSGSVQAISFLKHCGFNPEFYEWIARAEVGPTAALDFDRSIARKKASSLEITPLQNRADLDLFLDLQERSYGDLPGFYRTTSDDLVSRGFPLPATDYFLCKVDGRIAGTLWQITGGNRVYAAPTPEFRGTWVETAMWRYLKKHVAAQGLTSVVTELMSPTSEQNKAAVALGFVTEKMLVCYRKQLPVEAN